MSAQSAVVKFCVKMLTKNALKSSEVADEVKVIVLDSYYFKLHETSVLYVLFLYPWNRILF